MTNVALDGYQFSFPSEWNELTHQQLLDVAGILLMPIPDTDKQARIVAHFLDIENNLINYNERRYLVKGIYKYSRMMALIGIRKGKLKYIDNEDLYRLSESVSFLTADVHLTRQVLPVIRKKRNFHGPASGFGNLTLIEFAKADIKYRYYVSTQNPAYLNEFIAILYRPAAPGGDRQKYSDNCIKNAHYFEQLPARVKKAVLLWWEGCYQSLIHKFPHVFTGGSGDDRFGFAGMITELAGEKFGTVDQTADTNLLIILIYLEKLALYQSKK